MSGRRRAPVSRFPLTVTFPWDPCAVPLNCRLAPGSGRWRSSRRWSRGASRARDEVMVQTAGVRPDPEARFSVDLVLYRPDNRAGDIDAYAKLVLDAMEGYVYEDDAQVDALTIRRSLDREDPRLELTVAPLPDEKSSGA